MEGANLQVDAGSGSVGGLHISAWLPLRIGFVARRYNQRSFLCRKLAVRQMCGAKLSRVSSLVDVLGA